MSLRIVHLLTSLDDSREKRSIEELVQLIGYGCEYIQCMNMTWTGELPTPREANDRPFQLTREHYGCWAAHRRALEQLTEDVDAILICECDCVFTVPLDTVIERLRSAYQACVAHNLLCFTFGPRHGGQTIDDLGGNIVTTTRLIETHCYMVTRGAKDRAVALFELPWDAADYVWTIYGYDQRKDRIGIFTDKIIAVQGDGMSLVDKRMKRTEHHFRQITQN